MLYSVFRVHICFASEIFHSFKIIKCRSFGNETIRKPLTDNDANMNNNVNNGCIAEMHGCRYLLFFSQHAHSIGEN